MRYLPFLFIFLASLASGQEAAGPPENIAVEERVDLLTAELVTEKIKGEFAVNQAKLNGCSSELILNWRRLQADLNKQFQAASAKAQNIRVTLQEKYAAEGYILNAKLDWIKTPEN